MSACDARAECTLPRALVLPAAMDAKLRCEHDEDDNGLDDEMEELLGKCFAPRLRFDSAVGLEEAPSKVCFNAIVKNPVPTQPVPSDGSVNVTLHYGLAWPHDDGFTQMSAWRCSEDAATACTIAIGSKPWTAWAYGACVGLYELACIRGCGDGNAHTGDFQTLSIDAKVEPGVDRWFATVGATDIGTPASGLAALGTPNGDTWDVFLTPGKHHFFQRANAGDTYPMDVTLTSKKGDLAFIADLQESFHIDTLDCDDPHDGGGPSLQFTELHHVPALGTAGDLVGGTWVNFCSRDVRNQPGVAATHLPAPTTSLPGCDYFQAHFCDGSDQVAGAAAGMSYPRGVFDNFDGDPEKNHVDKCPSIKGSDNLDDSDDDGLPDACDADTDHESRYVGRGGTRSDGVTIKGTVAKVTSKTPLVTPSSYRGGYSDFDGDNVADGADLCPNDLGASADVHVIAERDAADWNRWAHVMNLQSVDLATREELERQTGYVHRGNACDPYPVTQSRASRDAGGLDKGPSLFCRGLIDVSHGASEIPIETLATLGTSANAQPSKQPRLFAHRAYRCDCQGDDGCLDNRDSACFRGRMGRPPTLETWAGWTPTHRPGCVLDADGRCAATPLALTPGVTTKVRSTWAWVDELTAAPALVRPGSVSDVVVEGTPAKASADKFAIRTMFDEGESLTVAPGLLLYWDQTRALYGEPDTGVTGAQLKLNILNTDENRRTRSSVASTLVQPHSEYTTQIDTGDCQLFDKDWFARWFARVRHPDPIDELLLQVFTRPGGLDQVRLRSPLDGVTRPVVGDDSWSGWMGQPGALGVLASAGLSTTATVGDSVSLTPATNPTLVWIQTGTTTSSRWALTVPTRVGEADVTYTRAFEGEAPFGLTGAARVITDHLRDRVVVVDPATGLVAAWDPVRRARSHHTVEAARRTGAAFALDGATLFVTGGGTGESLSSTELVLVDVFDGTSFTREGIPARRDGLLTLASDSHTLVFGGGIDAAGRAHDDVWTLDFARPSAAPVKLASDTAGGRLVAGEALLDVAVKAPRLRALSLGTGLPELRERVDSGWRALDAVDTPACTAADLDGGQLCSLGGSPWAAPGRLTCDTSADPHACLGAPGDVEATRTLGRGVVAVDVTADTVWSLRGRSLEQRIVPPRPEDVTLRHIPLGARASALSASDEGVMIATERGFSYLAPGAAAPAEVSVCGRGVAVDRLSPGVWIGATSQGVVLLSVTNGTPTVTREARAVTADDSDEDESDVSLSLSSASPGDACPSRRQRCHDDAHAAVLALGARDVLWRRGSRVARIRVDASGFVVVGEARAPLHGALSFDPLGQRVYGDRRHGTAVFDLRGGGLRATSVDDAFDGWIGRRDSGTLSARLRHGRVELARVVR